MTEGLWIQLSNRFISESSETRNANSLRASSPTTEQSCEIAPASRSIAINIATTRCTPSRKESSQIGSVYKAIAVDVAQAVAEVVAAIVEYASGHITREVLANYRIPDGGRHRKIVNKNAAAGCAGNIFFDHTSVNNQWIRYNWA